MRKKVQFLELAQKSMFFSLKKFFNGAASWRRRACVQKIFQNKLLILAFDLLSCTYDFFPFLAEY